MNRRLKIVLVLFVAIVTLAFTTLVLASETQNFVFSRSLHVGEFAAEGDSYSANITDAEAKIADVYVRVESPQLNSPYIPILVSIWHTEDTELDSMVLTFSAYPNTISLYLEARQSSWPETEFSRTGDGKGVIFSVHDLGPYGTGTVRSDLLMIQYSQYTSENNLHLTVELSMHQKTLLQLTSLKTYANVYIPIPS